MSELVAHRGFPACYPENTLVGIQAAVEAGARFVEVDVQLTADGVPVLYHDRTMVRVSQKSGAIHQYGLEELSTFRAFEFEKFGYRYAQTPITTLEQLAGFLVSQPAVTVFVEIKRVCVDQFGAEKVVTQVVKVLERVRKQCVIISYSLDALQAVHQCGWKETAAVVDEWKERRHPRIVALKPPYLFCGLNSLPRFSRPVYEFGKLGVFQTCDPALARNLFRRGIHFVETDNIGMMISETGKPA